MGRVSVFSYGLIFATILLTPVTFMNNYEVIAICLFGLMLVFAAYWIIVTTRINQRKTSFLEKQMRLLARIAKKLGVDPQDVDHVVGGKRRRSHSDTNDLIE